MALRFKRKLRSTLSLQRLIERCSPARTARTRSRMTVQSGPAATHTRADNSHQKLPSPFSPAVPIHPRAAERGPVEQRLRPIPAVLRAERCVTATGPAKAVSQPLQPIALPGFPRCLHPGPAAPPPLRRGAARPRLGPTHRRAAPPRVAPSAEPGPPPLQTPEPDASPRPCGSVSPPVRLRSPAVRPAPPPLPRNPAVRPLSSAARSAAEPRGRGPLTSWGIRRARGRRRLRPSSRSPPSCICPIQAGRGQPGGAAGGAAEASRRAPRRAGAGPSSAIGATANLP